MRCADYFHCVLIIIRLAQAVKIMISCGVFVANAVVTQVAIDLAWTQYFVGRLTESSNKLMWEYFLRTGIVCVTCKL